MNKVLVKLYMPTIQEEYDIWLPKNKKIYNIIILILKGVNELGKKIEIDDELPILYNKLTGLYYDINLSVQDTDINNGTELILI